MLNVSHVMIPGGKPPKAGPREFRAVYRTHSHSRSHTGKLFFVMSDPDQSVIVCVIVRGICLKRYETAFDEAVARVTDMFPEGVAIMGGRVSVRGAKRYEKAKVRAGKGLHFHAVKIFLDVGDMSETDRQNALDTRHLNMIRGRYAYSNLVPILAPQPPPSENGPVIDHATDPLVPGPDHEPAGLHAATFDLWLENEDPFAGHEDAKPDLSPGPTTPAIAGPVTDPLKGITRPDGDADLADPASGPKAPRAPKTRTYFVTVTVTLSEWVLIYRSMLEQHPSFMSDRPANLRKVDGKDAKNPIFMVTMSFDKMSDARHFASKVMERLDTDQAFEEDAVLVNLWVGLSE